ncbi:MEDS domain-containing protein [Blastococcus xanthinilyticus]|uniref:STAS domain-containing protein n=1 Tax=Blastococcus xanthinilyticus TaxID=1564164 RepID=A0A5S5D2Z2_9ACTN|nr:MEDS domain-containing protein [Blastococcus xanthinilyticus]TYP90350.1 STAS domain-containing protein [Blastococcus xanthinilyticus]
MRVHGLVTEVPVPGAQDHLCWVYRDEQELDGAALEFLAGGLAAGQRLLCVGDRVVAGLLGNPDALGGPAALVASGALRTLSLAEAYAAAGAFSAERQRAFYDAATREALADGYTGLRVLAEVSPLAADPAHQAELARWEHAADAYVASGPGMTAMCAYRDDVPPAALADCTAVHPLVHAPGAEPPFRVFHDAAGLAVAGEVDVLGAERLARALTASPVPGGACALDLSQLTFADVAACRAIAAWAAALTGDGVRVELWNAPALLRRMWHLLALDECTAVSFRASA